MSVLDKSPFYVEVIPSLVKALAADPVAPTTGGKGVDLTPLTNSVNFNSVLVGIMAVAGSLILLYAGSAGVKWILRMVKSA